MNPTSTPNGLPASLSPSPSHSNTSNGPLSSPVSGTSSSTSSPVVQRSAIPTQASPILARAAQPEQIIVPVGNMINPNKSSSDSSSRQISSIGTPQVSSAQIPSMATSAASASASSSVAGAASSDGKGVLEKSRLRELVKEVDPLEQMDDDVEDVLLQVADDFIENVVSSSCQLAKHRRSNTLEAKDVQLYLERSWNMQIPGFGSEEIRPFKKSITTEAHKQRMALIRKTLKKY